MSGLPDGWAAATIGEVTASILSIDPRREPSRRFGYVDIGAIDNRVGVIAGSKVVTGADAPSRARRIIRTGDTLFSTVRTYLKNVAQVPSDLDGQLTSTGIAVLRPTDAVDPSYLFKWCRHSEFIDQLSSSQDGTMYPAVTDRDVTNGPIPLPPLPEQRRIVAKLDRLSARSKAARDHLARATHLAARAKQALLAAAFRGDLTAEWRRANALPAWQAAGVGALVASVTAGKNLQCEERPPLADERGVVKVSAVTWGRFDPHASKTLPRSFEPTPRTEIRAGDLLFSRANTIELVGACVIVDQAPGNLYLSDKILRLEVDPAERRWLMHFLRSPQGREGIEDASTGNQLSMRNISQKALAAIPMPWPSPSERVEIVRRIEAAFARIDRLAEEAARAARLLDRLDERLLARAFRGELVPQDPADEPAQALLARLREARARAPKTKRGRRAPP